MNRFNKPAEDLPAQLNLLEQRGLVISNRAQALSLLENIGYYRFSAYTYPFREGTPRNTFKEGTTLEQIIRIYDFDRELRLLVADAIERAEVGIRTRIVNHSCLHFSNPHWFMDSSHFHPRFNHNAFTNKLERHLNISYDRQTGARIMPEDHPETFIEHYYLNYGDPYLPPFWMTAEVLTLGSLSHLYKGIGDNQLKKDIATPFGVPAKILTAWLHAIAHLRNICAHHGRLWNRKFSISPPLSRKHRGILHHPHRFEGHSVVLLEILDVCSPNHSWRQRLDQLLVKYPEIDPQAMGYSQHWKQEPFWNLT